MSLSHLHLNMYRVPIQHMSNVFVCLMETLGLYLVYTGTYSSINEIAGGYCITFGTLGEGDQVRVRYRQYEQMYCRWEVTFSSALCVRELEASSISACVEFVFLHYYCIRLATLNSSAFCLKPIRSTSSCRFQFVLTHVPTAPVSRMTTHHLHFSMLSKRLD